MERPDPKSTVLCRGPQPMVQLCDVDHGWVVAPVYKEKCLMCVFESTMLSNISTVQFIFYVHDWMYVL